VAPTHHISIQILAVSVSCVPPHLFVFAFLCFKEAIISEKKAKMLCKTEELKRIAKTKKLERKAKIENRKANSEKAKSENREAKSEKK
jgi:hypothetical protein